MRRAVRALVTLAGVGYPLALAALVAAFSWIGEQWWPLLGAMYLPPWGWALPFPVIVLVLLVSRRWLLLALQIVSAWLLVHSLMGLEIHGTPEPSGPSLTVFTRNMHQGVDGLTTVMDDMQNAAADIVLVQEARGKSTDYLRKRFAGWQMHAHDEFVLLTRFRIKEVVVPPPVKLDGKEHNARFVHYVLETPFGLMDVFNVHPLSPRDALEEIRGQGLSYEIRSGRVFFNARARRDARRNTMLRLAQVEAFTALARASNRPVIIGGDTNLPGPSRIRREKLSAFQDAFSTVGTGFGYTFPAHHPWLRLDRILVNHHLAVVRVGRGAAAGSDHVGVRAVVTRR